MNISNNTKMGGVAGIGVLIGGGLTYAVQAWRYKKAMYTLQSKAGKDLATAKRSLDVVKADLAAAEEDLAKQEKANVALEDRLAAADKALQSFEARLAKVSADAKADASSALTAQERAAIEAKAKANASSALTAQERAAIEAKAYGEGYLAGEAEAKSPTREQKSKAKGSKP